MDLTPWMVVRLQNKCLILLLSLLEMRDLSNSLPLIRRIMRSLPINVLEVHMAKTFKKFKAIYKDDYSMQSLNHLEEDPRVMEEEEL